MVQVPVAANDAVLPAAVQTPGVSDVKLTGRPEFAVACRFSVVPTLCFAIVGKVMVCFVSCFDSTVKLCETGVAAEYVASPACEATIVHVPGPSSEAVAPDTAQTEGVIAAKLTGSPELAVAVRLSCAPAV
jgi:hypothetical protein